MATNTIPLITLKKEPGGTSDRTLKTDVTHVRTALSKILALRPVTWRWKSGEANRELQYGFIAQEVETVLPKLVSEERGKDGTAHKVLTTNDMMPYVIRAIQEQQTQIKKLQQLIENNRNSSAKSAKKDS